MNKISSIRKDWGLIETLMEENRSILDIGCGDGMLMEQLEKNLNARTHGIELDRDLALKAIAKGFNVIHGNAEVDLSQYSNNSFDYVIFIIFLKTFDVIIKVQKLRKIFNFLISLVTF